MLLTNLMEDIRLNFDQPLLSVRRHNPLATSHRNDKRNIKNSQPFIRRPPPHRSELKSGLIRNPGSVPFLWEQSPGQPKEETKPQTQSYNKPPIAPKLPPGRCVKADPQDCRKVSVSSPRINDNERQDVDAPHDENVKNSERSKETVDEKESSDSGDSDEAYMDALDTLSRAESSFLNCSMSGLSGLDDKNVKPSGNFPPDVQTREFMMDRFLPAAKAMASEAPQYAPKKQRVVQQQLQHVKKTGNQYKPTLRYGPSFAARYSHCHESEEEESDDEYDHHQNLPSVCGLLPRFCLKSSLRPLSPTPAISVRTPVSVSSAKKVQRRSSSVGSYSETEMESRSDRTGVKRIGKMEMDEVDEANTKSSNESGQLESLSSSTYRDSSLPFLEDKEALSVPEESGTGFKTFQELLDDQESRLGDSIVERTLYVDTEQKVDASLKEIKKLNTVKGESGENWDFSQVSTIKETVQEVTVTEQTIECLEKQLSQAVTPENSRQTYTGLPTPPPLPKSPSDSWLWRTLPSIPTKSLSLRSYLNTDATNLEKQCKKSPTSDMKWETIVKTTKVQHRHLHYSEESLTTIPET